MPNETGSASTKLGTVVVEQDFAGTKLQFPTDLELFLQTLAEGAKVRVVANLNLANLQSNFDAIVKSFPMPNDTSGYGTKFVASVENASLQAAGDTAVVDANINVQVWQIEKGLPGAGATLRTKQQCTDFGWPIGRICINVPEKVEIKPGDDIKLKLVEEGIHGRVALSLATPDGQSVEVRPGDIHVVPRGDVGKFLNEIAGIFDSNLSSLVRREVADIISDGTLRKSLPEEMQAFSPSIASIQFLTRPDGALGVAVDFQAMITAAQLTEWMQKAMAEA